MSHPLSLFLLLFLSLARQTFKFNLINENDLVIACKDEVRPSAVFHLQTLHSPPPSSTLPTSTTFRAFSPASASPLRLTPCHPSQNSFLQDVSADDLIGSGRAQLARARVAGTDRQSVPMMSKNGKQHGHVQITLNFVRNSALSGVSGQ
jgi:hypothetical protein